MSGDGALERKIQILGSHKEIFSPHSSAKRRKNVEVRFHKLGFVAKMITSKHALNVAARDNSTKDPQDKAH